MRRQLVSLFAITIITGITGGCNYSYQPSKISAFDSLFEFPLQAGFDRIAVMGIFVQENTKTNYEHQSLFDFSPEVKFCDPEWIPQGAENGFIGWTLGKKMKEGGDGRLRVYIADAEQAKTERLVLLECTIAKFTELTPASHKITIRIPIQGSFRLEPQLINYLGRLCITINAIPGYDPPYNPTPSYSRTAQDTEYVYSGGSYQIDLISTNATMEEDVAEARRKNKGLAKCDFPLVRQEPVIRPALR